jgi:NAD(P)-dependent dehydrogenase (short-subunit alcohol dehydrogenase family)
MKNLLDMSGKTVLITGGSRGLGRAMALGFAEQGADIAVVSRKLEACEKTAAEIESLGVKAFPYACHVGDWEALAAMADAVYNRFGKVDVLINNAGMSPLAPSSLETTEALFDKVIAVNFKGPFRLTALVGSRMAAGNGGSIINISSIESVRPRPLTAPYSGAKAALNAITIAYAHEYGPKVRVNCIMCGPFLTDVAKVWAHTDEFKTRAKAEFALQRAGKPEEIVSTALYLASDASSFTAGAIIRVDGGTP